MQDLERQLAEHKEVIKQLSEVRQVEVPPQAMDLDSPETPHSTMTDPRSSAVKLPMQAQRNIRRFSCGIFETPFDAQKNKSHRNSPLSSHRLPPKQAVDRLLPYYYHSIHRGTRVFEWDYFVDCYETVYKRGSFATVNTGWVALFYAILAMSTMLAADSPLDTHAFGLEGRQFIEQASKILDDENDDIANDHCLAALLVSIYYIEINERSAARKYLTSSVEYAYKIGLHEENENLHGLEAECRRRLWWWVYTWDR